MSSKPQFDKALPRDNRGRYVPLTCPDINCSGQLVYEGAGKWYCDGLVDPNHADKPLEACRFAHWDGDKYP